MPRYNEITTRHKMIGRREFQEGAVVRTVSISLRDAAILNSEKNNHGLEYVLEANEPTRAELFARAAELGLSPAKNIKTDELKKLIENA
jgi:hypothetical protein